MLKAFESLDEDKKGHLPVGLLYDRFDVSQSQAFLTGKASKDQLFAACGFEEIVQDGHISQQDFIDLYTDVSMAIESTEYFVEMVEHCWNVCGHDHNHATASKTDISHLVAMIRQKLLSMSGRQSDEYVLRTVFTEFDVNGDGSLCAEEMQKLLAKLQIRVGDQYVKELMVRFDRNKNGRIEFDEFVQFIIHNPYK